MTAELLLGECSGETSPFGKRLGLLKHYLLGSLQHHDVIKPLGDQMIRTISTAVALEQRVPSYCRRGLRLR
ncbi:MAG: hypothetical protein ACREX3_17585 [Gammaproteobacteria bacterium]